MDEIKLRDWENEDEVGTRFPVSQFECPECGEKALEDNWPPNYGGGSTCWLEEEDVIMGEFSGSQKCVCTQCKIAFKIFLHEESKGGSVVKREVDCSEIVSLVEKDGCWLTPHDVWREEYKDEHGEYPKEIYG